jgi:hypothetical protein
VKHEGKLEYSKLANVIYRTASIIGFMKNEDTDLLDHLCDQAIHLFDPAGIRIFLNALTWITSYRPSLSAKVLENLCHVWEKSATARLGIYSKPQM